MRGAGGPSGGDGGAGTLFVLLGGDLAGPSSGATIVQVGDIKYVASIADLDAFAPADGGGQRTIAQPVQLTVAAFPSLPVGEFIFGLPGASIAGTNSQSSISGNVAGGLLRGEIICHRLVVSNAGGVDISMTSTGAPVIFGQCNLVGPNGAGNVSSIQSGSRAVFTECLFQFGGLVFSGAIDLWRVATCVVIVPAGSVGIDSSAALGSGNLEGCQFITVDPAGRALKLTGLTSPLSVFIDSCRLLGPGVMFDVAGFDATDVEVLMQGCLGTGNANVRNSRADPASLFSDLVATSNATALADTWTVVPFRGAPAGNILTALGVQERWALVEASTGDPLTAATLPTDWAIEYIGGQTYTSTIAWSATVRQGGGGSPNAQFRWALEPAGGGGYVGIEGSSRTQELGNLWNSISSQVTATFSPGDRIRFETRTIGVAADTDTGEFQVSTDFTA